MREKLMLTRRARCSWRSGQYQQFLERPGSQLSLLMVDENALITTEPDTIIRRCSGSSAKTRSGSPHWTAQRSPSFSLNGTDSFGKPVGAISNSRVGIPPKVIADSEGERDYYSG